MEQTPFDNSFSAEKPTDEKDKKKNKSSRFKFVAPVVEASDKKTEVKAERSEAEKAKTLAELLMKPQNEKAAETEKPQQTETSEAAEGTEAAAEGFTTDYDQEIKAEDLPPNQIFSEGIIDLGKPDEQILALRGEQSNSESEPEIEQEPTFDRAEAPVWNTQPEQQHQARADEYGVSSESSAPDASERSVNAEPEQTTPAEEAQTPWHTTPEAPRPQSHAMTAEAEPEPQAETPVHPAYYNTAPAEAPVQAKIDSNEQLITQKQHEDEMYYATAAAARHGVLAGGLFFGGLEHFKHRRREKRQAKAMKQQAKNFEKEREQHQFQLAEQEKQVNQKEQQIMQLQDAERRNQATGRFSATPEAAPSGVRGYEQLAATEKRVESSAASSSEKQFNEQLEKLVPKQPEVVRKRHETETAEQLEIPAEHHLETSAWHTIEVDTKTGKAVENPTFAYGQEYYRERAKEAIPRTDGQKQAAGEVALVAAAITGDDTSGAVSSQAPPPDASRQQKMTPREIIMSKAKGAVKTGKKAATGKPTSGPLWPWVVAFVAVVVLIIIAL